MPRITQKDIARLAGVSQTTVSFVLNDKGEQLARVPEATRARILKAIQETGYVADPIARRLKQVGTGMIGVYTYESLFPLDREDFFHPFLAGIEEEAQNRDIDLLLLTSGRVGGRRGGLSGGTTRLRLADSCILLGQRMPREELEFLNASGFSFVSVGRRDDAGGPVPYVAADYASIVRELISCARALGHTRFAYAGHGEGVESYTDRMAGARAELGDGFLHLVPGPEASPREWIRRIATEGVTVVLAEQEEQFVLLQEAADAEGVAVPGDLSLVSLSGSADRTGWQAGFELPRRDMGRRAVQILIEGDPARREQQLLRCTLVDGASLAAAPA
ncbi:LacI family transcriptional regulator [Rathayibacter sp. AY1D1]|uniref:LacI family DNA-binding transcriptional regulator n=1 Tax=Rathayibacter sp. AY1D1 TaxID=2080542 RepID=UPI000CE7D043|nr:LacI family DNA-binding transcriptional regulator [Rathayibacter sp. AY1D1]PPH97220.1 LacI family transcriptional regulator [Rathayibacter sp. AY1D1]